MQNEQLTHLINFDRARLERFKARMEETKPDEVFAWEGVDFFRPYALYLVEFLEGRIP